MKIKDIFNIKNISNFIEGNSKYFYDKLNPEPWWLREQRAYRLLMCKDDCVPKGKCKHCGCPPEKKVFVDESCNGGERFPDIMKEDEWIKFKEDNGIV